MKNASELALDIRRTHIEGRATLIPFALLETSFNGFQTLELWIDPRFPIRSSAKASSKADIALTSFDIWNGFFGAWNSVVLLKCSLSNHSVAFADLKAQAVGHLDVVVAKEDAPELVLEVLRRCQIKSSASCKFFAMLGASVQSFVTFVLWPFPLLPIRATAKATTDHRIFGRFLALGLWLLLLRGLLFLLAFLRSRRT